MKRQKLVVHVREEKGKEKVKKLRTAGDVPGVVYKKGTATVNIKVNHRALFEVLHTKAGENVLLDLEMEDGGSKPKKKTVIIKEVQHHPIKDVILHVDFNEILLTETIKIDVPIVAKGECEGVVKDGGTLEYILREAEIECLPTQIPERIEVQVEALKIGDSIYIKDLVVPSGIKILNEPELTVISIEPPYKEEEVVEGAEGEEGATEPELIAKAKKDDEILDEAEGKAADKKQVKEPAKEEKKPKQ